MHKHLLQQENNARKMPKQVMKRDWLAVNSGRVEILWKHSNVSRFSGR